MLTNEAQEKLLLAAISAEPEDVTFRYAYIDWLSEQGISQAEVERRFLALAAAYPNAEASYTSYADWLVQQADERMRRHGEFIQLARKVDFRTNSDERNFAIQLLSHNSNDWLERVKLPQMNVTAVSNVHLWQSGVSGYARFYYFDDYLKNAADIAREFPVKDFEVDTIAENRIPEFMDALPPSISGLALSLGVNDMAALVAHPRMRQIQKLNISRSTVNSIADEDIVILAEAETAKNLRYLDLECHNIGDTGAILLATSPVFANLEQLYLQNNDLTIEGHARLSGFNIEGAPTIPPVFREKIKVLSSVFDTKQGYASTRPINDEPEATALRELIQKMHEALLRTPTLLPNILSWENDYDIGRERTAIDGIPRHLRNPNLAQVRGQALSVPAPETERSAGG